MDISTKSKFFNRNKAAVSNEEISSITEELKSSLAEVDKAAETPVESVVEVKKEQKQAQQHFFGIQKANKHYIVIHIIEENGKQIKRDTVFSTTNIAVAQAKLGELITRLVIIKKVF